MTRSTALIFVLLVGLAGASQFTNPGNTEFSQKAQSDFVFESKKKNKNNKLPKEVEKAIEPLVVLKNQLESHIPQKELNAMKQMAFQILLIARRYL